MRSLNILKFLSLALPLVLFSKTGLAQSMEWVHIVTADLIDTESGPETKYSVVKIPAFGCGSAEVQATQLEQFTADFLVNENMGCGGSLPQNDEDESCEGTRPKIAVQKNINFLSCVQKPVKSVISKDYKSISKITLDISKCPDKDNKELETKIRTAANNNFPQTQPLKPRKLANGRIQTVQVEVELIR